MERDIIDIVKEKSFYQLSAEERAELSEMCTSEEEFLQLKSVFAAVESMSAEELTPRTETKQKLDELFHQTHPGAAPVWYSSLLTIAVPREKPLHRQPLLQIAALVALILLAVPLFNMDRMQENTVLAELELPVEASEKDGVSNATSGSNVAQSAVEEKAEVASAVNDNSSEDLNRATMPGGTLSYGETRSIVAGTVGVSDAEAVSVADEHPDGIYRPTVENVSIATSETPGILDLLTTTF